MQFQTARQYAEANRCSHSHVRAQCRECKIPGAIRCGRIWLIPIGAEQNKKIILHTTNTLAKKFGRSQMQVRRWIKAKQIHADLVGRDYVIDPEQGISRTIGDKLEKIRERKKKGNIT